MAEIKSCLLKWKKKICHTYQLVIMYNITQYLFEGIKYQAVLHNKLLAETFIE